jgi:hypothetical protein
MTLKIPENPVIWGVAIWVVNGGLLLTTRLRGAIPNESNILYKY